MRLPGTRYQEHGWEQVRKLLGHCSLQAFAHCSPADLAEPDSLSLYVEHTADALRALAHTARAEAAANSYGDSVLELALSLLFELQARPADWQALGAAVASEAVKTPAFWDGPAGDAMLRKKVNDMYAVLRDKVDSDNYQVACGRACSPNKIYAYRMLDTAYGDIARLFGAWREHQGQVAAILGRAVEASPIEARQMQSIGSCKAEWVIRWSESLEQFGGGAGPLHTRSKRFSSMKNNPARIDEMLREIGDYQELSLNLDQDWRLDADEAIGWLEDLWRVLDEPAVEQDDGAAPVPELPPSFDPAIALSVSLPPRYMELAWLAQDRASRTVRMLAGESLPVRLAVYLKMLGPMDDTYPDEWLDPATGALPTMQQLAALDQVSLPTLRKRRDAAIAVLQGAAS